MKSATTYATAVELANAKCAIFHQEAWNRWCAEMALVHSARGGSEAAAWLLMMVREVRRRPESARAARYAAKLQRVDQANGA
jgi:hypothetical protein